MIIADGPNRCLLKCDTCGKIFERYRTDVVETRRNNTHQYCSRNCSDHSKHTRKYVPCSYCKKDVFIKPSRLKPSGLIFCNPECRMRYFWKNGIIKREKVSSAATRRNLADVANGTSPIMNDAVRRKGMITRSTNCFHGSGIERKMWAVLDAHGVEYEKQHIIRITNRKRYYIDIAIPTIKLAVECDGEAFHNAERDSIRDDDLARVGWRTMRFKGTEIYKNPISCLCAIEKEMLRSFSLGKEWVTL